MKFTQSSQEETSITPSLVSVYFLLTLSKFSIQVDHNLQVQFNNPSKLPIPERCPEAILLIFNIVLVSFLLNVNEIFTSNASLVNEGKKVTWEGEGGN